MARDTAMRRRWAWRIIANKGISFGTILRYARCNMNRTAPNMCIRGV